MPVAPAHDITPDDVKGWFGRNPPSDERCAHLAGRLNKLKWPSDQNDDEPSGNPNPSRDDTGDPRVATEHAKQLLEELESRDSETLQTLRNAIEKVLPEIEFPFGYGQALVEVCRQIQGASAQNAEAYLHTLGLPVDAIRMVMDNTPEELDTKLLQQARDQRRRWLHVSPRPHWNVLAFVVAQRVAEVLVTADRRVSFSQNSVLVRVVREAMKRMGCSNMDMISKAAIEKYLTRQTIQTAAGLRLRV
jgi:hypothetical protein